MNRFSQTKGLTGLAAGLLLTILTPPTTAAAGRVNDGAPPHFRIETVAGLGSAGFSGDGGEATEALIPAHNPMVRPRSVSGHKL